MRSTQKMGRLKFSRDFAASALGGPHHHHGGGGFRGGFGPYAYGYPYQYPDTEVVVVEQPSSSQSDEFKARAMAHIMSLPKAKRGAAYRTIFGKDPPNGALGDDSRRYAYQNADTGVRLTWKYGPPDSQHNYEIGQADLGAVADLGGLGAIAVPGKGSRKGIFANPTLNLPSPGAPEILVHGMNGLGTSCCSGCASGKSCKGMGESTPNALFASPARTIAVGVGAYLLYKHFKKKRR